MIFYDDIDVVCIGEFAEAAEAVSDRIESIEKVSEDLFEEWEEEIEEIGDASLRGKSESLMDDTKKSYTQLIAVMKKAESRMEPVLAAFKDHVLFLRHNLNARAIASLAEDVGKIESDVANLIQNMQESIDEADAFIASMES